MRNGMIAGAVAFCLSGAAVAQVDPVLVRAEIARQHMRQLYYGYMVYWNQYQAPPAHLTELYPHWVCDPRSFWHPGDRQPAPRTINNETPNALNSARISFDWPLNVDGAPDLPFLQDNTPANNGGRFVNYITWAGVIETDPPLATPTPTRDALARAHLADLARGLILYANDNQDYFPTDPIQLWEQRYLGAPRSFWNPGDSDPCPTAITNSVPNAPNSTQISFDFLVSGLTQDDVAPDSPLMRDNSPANNGGRFVYFITTDRLLETDPPNATLVPTRGQLARGHLVRLGMALRTWATLHGDVLPADLRDLWTAHALASPRSFWNPGDADPMPTDITNSVPNAPNSAQISFEYRAAGMNITNLPAGFVLIQDNTPANNDGYGVFTYAANGDVQFVPVCAGDVNQDGRVNWRDLLILVNHLGLQEGATPREGDLNLDGRVDVEDLAILRDNFGRICTVAADVSEASAGAAAQVEGVAAGARGTNSQLSAD